MPVTSSTLFIIRTVLLTVMALTAFAANSVLCRLALKEQAIDAASFTAVRLMSGAIMLFLLISITHKNGRKISGGSWYAGLMLFLYAITFSFAYITLDTGTGALILFGSVQITMILVAYIGGSRLSITEWLGVITACCGFVYLILPQVNTPSVFGFLLMTAAGVSWGLYTLKGRGSTLPLTDTAYNFFRAIPLGLILIVIILLVGKPYFSQTGIILAILSGSIASGIGYAIWYAALAGLSATQAAVIQLLVPVIAAIGGILFISEMVTMRLVISAILVLGGILMVVLGRDEPAHVRPSNS